MFIGNSEIVYNFEVFKFFRIKLWAFIILKNFFTILTNSELVIQPIVISFSVNFKISIEMPNATKALKPRRSRGLNINFNQFHKKEKTHSNPNIHRKNPRNPWRALNLNWQSSKKLYFPRKINYLNCPIVIFQ